MNKSLLNKLVFKSKANIRIIQEGGWIVFGQVLTVLGSLALVRVLTEFLEPVVYGQLALGLTISILINQTVMAGIIPGISRFYTIAVEKGEVAGYIEAAKKIMQYATICVAFIAFILILVLIKFGYTQWINLTVTILIFSILTGYNSIISQIQNAARQRAIVAFHTGLDAWLKIGLAILFMLLLGHSSESVIIGYTISSLFVTISQLYFLNKMLEIKKEGNPVPTIKIETWIRQVWVFAWPFSVWGVFTWAQQSSDRWALEMYGSSHDVGLYSVLYQLGYSPIIMLSTVLITFLSPILYEKSGDATNVDNNNKVHDLSWKLVKSCLLITVLIFGVSFFTKNIVFSIFVSEAFRETSYLFPWMILAGGLFTAGQILALKLMSDMKTAKIIPVKVCSAFLGVSLNILGVKYFGLIGVVAASVAFSLLYFIWIALQCRNV